MSESKEPQFREAADKGDLSLVKKLAPDTTLYLNWQGDIGITAFSDACFEGRVSVVQFLLTLPTVDVNKPQNQGATPFFIACQKGHKEVVSLLLADMRIDLNKPKNDQCTPLWFASQNGHLPVVQLILASGREVDTKTKSIAGTADWSNKLAAEVARRQGNRAKPYDGESDEVFTRRMQNCLLIAILIESFEENPQQVRTRLRKHLGLKG